MRLSDAELSSICDRASTLSERLSGQYMPVGDETSLSSRRLTRWRQLSGPSTAHQLATLLSVCGREQLSESELLSLLGPVTRAADMHLPPWASSLNEISESITQAFDPGTKIQLPKHRSQAGGKNIPFEDLYWPIAEFAWGRILCHPAQPELQIDRRARRLLQEYLVRRLSSVASTLLQTGFLACLAVEQAAPMSHFFGNAMPKAGHGNARRHYSSFVTEQGEDGLRSLFTRFPVAARMIAEVTENWIAFVSEFLERLQRDRDQLARCFNAGASLGHLLSVKAGMSDPHRGGRSVLILQFTSGLRLVYKPRPMEVDSIFYELVRKINDCSSDISLGVLKICDRQDYGWMEFARHESCQDIHAAKRYYRRAGILACLIHWLHGIDFHRENVVAAGEYPILVDLECLAHPLRPDEMAHVVSRDPSALANSVLRSGLLPLWQPRITGNSLYDNSGFNGTIRQRSFLPAPIWEDINTDRMRWVYRLWYHSHSVHRAKLNGRALHIHSFEREVITGYEQMTKQLEGASGERLQVLRQAIHLSLRRYVKRPTFVYATLIRHSLDTKFLRDGVDRSIELMALPLTGTEEADWNSEIVGLEKLDIPFFQLGAKIDRTEMSRQSIDPVLESAQQTKKVRLSVRQMAILSEGKIRAVSARHERRTSSDRRFKQAKSQW